MTEPAPHAVLPAPGGGRDALPADDRPATGPVGEVRRRRLPRGRLAHAGAVWALRIVILAALLGAWQWYGTSSGGVFVPSLTQTMSRLPDLVSSGALGHALWSSNTALLIGYPIAALVGMAIGFLIGRNRTADRALSYWLDVAMVVPIVAVIPIVIVALGLSLTARVFVVVLFALPVIALNSRAAVRVSDANTIEMARAFGCSKRQVWTSVILPAASTHLFTGLRIGIGRAISGMIIVELTLIPAGLGGLLLDYKGSFAGPDLYAVTLVVVLEGVVLTGLGHLAENRFARRMSGGKP